MAVTKRTKGRMTMSEAAFRILLRHGKPLHYRDITREALRRKYIVTGGKTPEQSLRTQLALEIHNKGRKSRFKALSQGIYDLSGYGKRLDDFGDKEKAIAKKTSARKATAKKATAKKSAPEKTVAKKASPRKAAAKKSAPKKTVAKKTVAKQAAPKRSTGRKTAPKKAVAGKKRR